MRGLTVEEAAAQAGQRYGKLMVDPKVTADIADSLGLKKAEGAIVDEPQLDSPAAKAGIMAGDVITALGGSTVRDSRMLARSISEMAPGTSVRLGVLHNGNEAAPSMLRLSSN